ncbi:hypothetical protein JCGZ_13509 [Jatropha curcas]|uniref:Uncharacterized protein n=1 Tax=Jatropha curcas TaxID=180498 RepID=A0A067KAV1_JATCU|nr:hypothetical protein JCGZ_13509 [Jatropha curcas]
MVGISWQLLTQNQDFLIGTGMLPGTVWGVPGSGSLGLSTRACFSGMVWGGSRARACALARAGACTPLEVWKLCSTGVLQLHGPSFYLQCGHGRASWHGLGRASLWKSEAFEARACILCSILLVDMYLWEYKHGLGRTSLWKSEAFEARACALAWAGACAFDSCFVLPCNWHSRAP